MNIFELTQEWLLIMDMIAEAEGEITEEIQLLIDKIEGDVAHKFMSMRYIIKSFEAKIAANEEEIARLEKNVVSSKKAIDRMKETMIAVLKVVGAQEISKTSGERTYKLKSVYGNYSTFPTVKLDVVDNIDILSNDEILIENKLVKKVITLEIEPSKEKELIGLYKDNITSNSTKLDKKELLAKLKDKTISETDDYKIDKSSYQIRM